VNASIIPQVFVNAILISTVYALIAMGLALIFGVMKVVQFAHGQVYMIGAYIVFYLTFSGQNYYVSLAGAVVFAGLLGLVLERIFFRRVRGQPLPSMIVGMGLYLLLDAAVVLIFGGLQKHVAVPIRGILYLGLITITKWQIFTFVACGLFIALIFLVLSRTKSGYAMRAVAQDEDAALLQGINVNSTNALGVAIGCGLAAVAGGLLIPTSTAIPGIGDNVIMKAFMITIIGGMGNIKGAIVAAFIFGVVESFAYTYLGNAGPVIEFVIVIIILIFRPLGILKHA